MAWSITYDSYFAAFTLMLRDGHAGRGWRAHPVAFHQHEGAYYPVWLLRRFDAHVRH